MPSPQIMIDPYIQGSHQYLTRPDMGPTDGRKHGVMPTWSSGEVAKTFFGVAGSTLTGYIRGGKFGAERDSILPARADLPHQPYRWRLYDIERCAYALAENRAIDSRRLRLCLTMIKAVAEMHGYL